MVSTSKTKLETEASQLCSSFECGLASDNVYEASRLIGEGCALLKISVYPWGAEFNVLQDEKDGPGDGR